MFRKIAIYALTAAAALLVTARPARAGSATGQLAVSATVLSVCTITNATTNLPFGSYDPSAGAALDASVAVAVQCTYGSSYTVDMNMGANEGGTGTRRMAGPSGVDFLTYELYSDAGRTTPFPVAAGPSYSAPAPGALTTGMTAADFTVYGRIGAGQAVAAGAYSDSVTMTINF